MKLATLRTGRLDGELVLVSRDLKRMARVSDIAPTLQAALDDWGTLSPKLAARFDALEAGRERGEPFDQKAAHSPLPRAYQWADGSVYPGHNERMAKWRDREVDPRYYQEPWMYQGMSDGFLAPTDDIPAQSEAWGIDYEGEIAVVTGPVPYAATQEVAGRSILLVMIANDVSLRELIGPELSKGFGFVQSKPASSFAPVAVTLDEVGKWWRDHRLHRPLVSHVNGEKHGDPDAGEMTHGFDVLIAHVAKDAHAGARIDHRQRHGFEPGREARHELPRRAPRHRSARHGKAQDAVAPLRRPRSHRNVRRGRRLNLRRDRSEGGEGALAQDGSRAHAGFRGVSFAPPALKAAPVAAAFSIASRRSSASAAPSRPERNSPASSSPRSTGVSGGGRSPSTATGTRRFFASPRCFMRAVISWPI